MFRHHTRFVDTSDGTVIEDRPTRPAVLVTPAQIGRTIEGVVVGDYQGPGQFSGFYVQEEDADADADPATSEGIFVFNTAFPVARSATSCASRGNVVEFASGDDDR